MEGRVGDRVALDAKKVGQPRRCGVIKQVSKGLSGLRYTVAWDDGTSSIISPSLGNLTVERGRSNGKKKATPRPKAARKKAKRATKR